jgi:ribosomal protein S27AE
MEQRKTVKKKFTFELGEKEKWKKAMMLAAMVNNVEQIKAARFGVMKEYAIKIKEVQERIAGLNKLIESGLEEREVVAEEIFNHDSSEVNYLYKGKIIHTREMTDDEKQLSLVNYPPFVEPEKFKPRDIDCSRCGEKFLARHKFHKICENCQKLELHRFAGEA